MPISHYLFKEGYLFFLLPFIFINSCKTDFDIIAPYKEITVVYGLLDPAADTQYIKINKAFLGEGDALVMAQQKDSTNYAPGTIDAKLQRLNFDQVVETIQLEAATDVPKDPGIFSSPDQVLYRAKYKPVYNGSYKLVIYNKNDEQTLSSYTIAVGDIPSGDIIHPGPNEPINFTGSTNPIYQVLFKGATNTRLYSLVIRFHYTETNLLTNVTTTKYIDWDQGTAKAAQLNGNNQIAFRFNKTDFYGFVRSQLAVDDNLTRDLVQKPIEFRITYAGEELSTYIDVNQPSIGIVQEKPAYSNITNGIGIFSSRSDISLPRNMDAPSEDSLRIGQVTKDLNFQ